MMNKAEAGKKISQREEYASACIKGGQCRTDKHYHRKAKEGRKPFDGAERRVNEKMNLCKFVDMLECHLLLKDCLSVAPHANHWHAMSRAQRSKSGVKTTLPISNRSVNNPDVQERLADYAEDVDTEIDQLESQLEDAEEQKCAEETDRLLEVRDECEPPTLINDGGCEPGHNDVPTVVESPVHNTVSERRVEAADRSAASQLVNTDEHSFVDLRRPRAVENNDGIVRSQPQMDRDESVHSLTNSVNSLTSDVSSNKSDADVDEELLSNVDATDIWYQDTEIRTIYCTYNNLTAENWWFCLVHQVEQTFLGKPTAKLTEHRSTIRVRASRSYFHGWASLLSNWHMTHLPLTRVVDNTTHFDSEYKARVKIAYLDWLRRNWRQSILNVSGRSVEYAPQQMYSALRKEFPDDALDDRKHIIMVDSVSYYVSDQKLMEAKLLSSAGYGVASLGGTDMLSLIAQAGAAK